MSLYHEITKEDLEKFAGEWALEQVKSIPDPKEAAVDFYMSRIGFIEKYNELEPKD
ncbi:MAG: hypothetical protein JZU49_02885 [Sulfuricurvum sp.]|nr:hypothetical protein [Sulfuricurvum sp.]